MATANAKNSALPDSYLQNLTSNPLLGVPKMGIRLLPTLL
jgi:hypothetical protein